MSSIFRTPNVLPFLLARVLAVFAVQIQAVVVAWQVYDMTRDPWALAWAGLAQFIPMLLLLVPAGDIIDRYSRRTILFISWGVAALCSALLCWASFVHASVNYFYAILVLYGCSRAFAAPTLQSLLPQLVPRDQLAKALAVNNMLMRSAGILGPACGGLLYAYGGGVMTYAMCLAALVAGLLLLTRVNVQYTVPVLATDASSWQRFREGIRFIRNRPIVLGTISLDLFAVLLGGVVALLPIYANDILQVGADGLGLLRSSMALGEVAMGLYLARWPIQHRVGMVMFIAVGMFGLANLVFSLSPWFGLSLAMLALAGACDMVSVNIRSTLVQFATPDAMRGRVNAVNMLFISSSNELGEFRAGAMAAWLGAMPAAVIGSLFTLGTVGLWTKLFKPLVAVDRFDDADKYDNHN